MKSNTKYSMWMIICYILTIALAILMLSCDKEPATAPNGYRLIYPIEGTYTGELIIHCDSLSYNKQRTDQVEVLCYDGERLTVHNSLGTGYGHGGYNSYRITMEYFDQTDCGDELTVMMQCTGVLQGDSLNESGRLYIRKYGKPYTGTYTFKGKR